MGRSASVQSGALASRMAALITGTGASVIYSMVTVVIWVGARQTAEVNNCVHLACQMLLWLMFMNGLFS